MKILCFVLVALGACLMWCGTREYYKSLIKLKIQIKAKKIFSSFIYIACMIMMLFFMAAYAVITIVYITCDAASLTDLLVAVIFFFGAVFVISMVTMVKRMFTAVTDKAALEKQLERQELMNERLIREKEQAEQGSRSKSDFLSRMSHEMRTPMNAIIGMTSIGLKERETNRKNYCFNRIESASTHLLGVINDILDMSKIEANKLELSCADFNIDSMIKKIFNVVSYQMNEKQQQFILSVDPDVPKIINTDNQRLSQVITNLLGNAVKFTPEGGGISLFIRMIGRKNEIGTLQFEVKDNGIGMSEEQREKLFNPFEQADGGISRKYGGTGLGLAISKRIVGLMNGNIRVESEYGKGASFIFDIQVGIPELKQSHDPDVAADDAVTTEQFAEGCFKGKKILIAEDIEINREIIAELLEFTGTDIDFAKNGLVAYNMFSSNPEAYNMIFMDLHMPEMSGHEATKKIRFLDCARAKTIPIIAMTADVFHEDIEKCLAAGMNGHVGKPLNIVEVLKKIRQYCL